MKHTKLVPNANFSKEWEGYMKSWPLHKKQSLKKKLLRRRHTDIPSSPAKKSEEPYRFSIQEIKAAAQKSSVFSIPCSKDAKLNQ